MAHMPEITPDCIQKVLRGYSIYGTLGEVNELLRYNYTDGKSARIIVKCAFDDREPVVLKFRNEEDVTARLIEEQTEFSQELMRGGVPTARFYTCAGKYVSEYAVCGYDLLVTCERFCGGQVRAVTPDIAFKTGAMLAKSHNISEERDCHVDCPVLFDPLGENDLFSFAEFKKFTTYFPEENELWARTERVYAAYMGELSRMKSRKRYAVQGDVSCENLFVEGGGVGVFDFNRCGDNVLFFDAAMQAVYESILMDYPEELTEEYSRAILTEFLRGYNLVRPFTQEECALFGKLSAVCRAFWKMDLIYAENSVKNLLETDRPAALEKLKALSARLFAENFMPQQTLM